METEIQILSFLDEIESVCESIMNEKAYQVSSADDSVTAKIQKLQAIKRFELKGLCQKIAQDLNELMRVNCKSLEKWNYSLALSTLIDHILELASTGRSTSNSSTQLIEPTENEKIKSMQNKLDTMKSEKMRESIQFTNKLKEKDDIIRVLEEKSNNRSLAASAEDILNQELDDCKEKLVKSSELINELQKTIAEQQTKLSNAVALENEFSQCKMKFNESQTELESKTKEITELTATLEKNKVDFQNQLDAVVTELKTKVTDYELMRDENESNKKLLRESNKDGKSVEALNKQVMEYKTKVDLLTMQKKQMQKECDQMIESNSQLITEYQDTIAKLKEQLISSPLPSSDVSENFPAPPLVIDVMKTQEYIDIINQLKAKDDIIQTLNSNIVSMKNDLENTKLAHNAELKEYSNQMQAKIAEILESSDRVSELEKELKIERESRAQEMLDLSNRLKLKEGELHDSKRRICELEVNVSDVENRALVELATCRKTMKEADARAAELEKELKQAQQFRRNASFNSLNNEADILALTSAKDGLEAKVIQLETVLKSLTDDNDRLNLRNRELDSQLSESIKSRTELSNTIQRLEDEMRAMESAEAGMTSAKQAKSVVENRVQSLENEIVSARKERDTANGRYEKLSMDNRKLLGELENAKQAKDLAEREMVVLQAELLASQMTVKSEKESKDELLLRYSQSSDNATRFENEIQDYQRQIKQLQSKISENENYRDELEKSKKAEIDARQVANDMEAELVRVKAELSSTKNEAKNSTFRLSKQIVSGLSRTLTGKKSNELTRKDSNIDDADLQEQISLIIEEKRDALHQVTVLEKELEKSRDNSEELRKKCAMLQAEVATAKESINDLTVKLNDATNQLMSESNEKESALQELLETRSEMERLSTVVLQSKYASTRTNTNATNFSIDDMQNYNDDISFSDAGSPQNKLTHTMTGNINFGAVYGDDDDDDDMWGNVAANTNENRTSRSESNPFPENEPIQTYKDMDIPPEMENVIRISRSNSENGILKKKLTGPKISTHNSTEYIKALGASSSTPHSDLGAGGMPKPTRDAVKLTGLSKNEGNPKPTPTTFNNTNPLRAHIEETTDPSFRPELLDDSFVDHHVNRQRQFIFDDSAPIILIELGSFYTRLSTWNRSKHAFETRYTCRSCTAIAANHSQRFELVRFASSQSDPMYQKFRDDGMFVGSDACFCAFDHPDRGLRSALKLLPIISNGHIVDAQGFVSLLDHVVSRGMKMFGDTSCSQVLFAHKISFSMQELQQVVQTIVEVLQCTKICLINEVSLIPRSISRNTPSAAIVVDIGAYQTSVYPIYEGLIFSSKVQTTNVGSEHVTEYLQLLLYAQNCESYNNLMPRRCKEIARDVKEKTAMVVRNYKDAQEMYGKFIFELIQVMDNDNIRERKSWGGTGTKKSNSGNIERRIDALALSAGSNMNNIKAEKVASKNRAMLTSLQRDYRCKHPDGSSDDIIMTIDIERFHCTEILFQPDLFEDCKGQKGISDLIIDVVHEIDDSVRADVFSTIIIAGGSSSIEGLVTRIRDDVSEYDVFLDGKQLDVIVAPSAVAVPTSNSSPGQVSKGSSVTKRLMDHDKSRTSGGFMASSDGSHGLGKGSDSSSVTYGATNRLRATLNQIVLPDSHEKSRPREPIDAEFFVTPQDLEDKGANVLQKFMLD